MSDSFTDKLRSLLDGPAYGNRYAVTLPNIGGTPKPGGGAAEAALMQTEDMSYMCTAARLPGTQINTIDRQIGMEPKKIAVGRVTPDISLTFLLDNSYALRKYFQEWVDCVASPQPPFMAGYLSNYGKDLTIAQKDKGKNGGKDLYSCKLIKCYPIGLTEIEFNNQAATSVLEFTVTLAYSQFEVS